MSPSTPVIRLVGGPPPLDGSRLDLSLSPHDRADADGDRFVRAVRGLSGRCAVGSLAELRERCTDRRAAEALATEWHGAVFASRRDRRIRTRYYRYQSTHRLVATRDGRGGWTLSLGERVSGTGPSEPSATSPACRTSDPDAGCGPDVWATLEAAVDDAATRFAAVAALLPDGPLAERASWARSAVGACVADATRLGAVGRLTAPGRPSTAGDDRAAALAVRVAAMVGTIEEATTHLVDLHLEVGDAPVSIEATAHLAVAHAELGHYAVSL